jgi:YD repeat-containing protein
MNRILQIIITCLLFAVIRTPVMSQELPRVIPPSPESASLFKFQDYPVSYSTGLPQISIPLYEVKSGSLTLPITLSYHSSGRKVYDETGAVGVGWSLQAGGMISRTVYGKPDDERWDFPSPFRRESEISNITDFVYLAAIGHHPLYSIPYHDTQYDIFSFSANQLSGKFVLKDENTTKSAVLIPYKPYVIEWHKLTTEYVVEYFDYINIIDDKGVLYRFGKSLKDENEYLEKSSEGVSSWLLTEIVSANKADTISFKYKSFVGERLTVSQESQMLYHEYSISGWNVAEWDYGETFAENTNRAYYSMQRLTEIKFKQGKITFNLNSKNCITTLEIKNKADKTVKMIELNRSQVNTISDGIKPVDKLNEVIFKDKFGNSIEKYAFQYYNSGKNFIDVRACDLSGYFNGKTNPGGVIDMRPFKIVPDGGVQPITPFKIEFDFSLRAPTLYILEGVLEKIVYPTGGSTKFIYELNKFYDAQIQASREGAGLRVSQIITDDNKGNVLYKTFKYGDGENGYGFLNIIPSAENISDYSIEYSTRYQNFGEGAGGPVLENSFSQCIVSSDILPVFQFLSEKPIIYSHVTEYHGTPSDNIGKTVYKYDFDDRMGPTTIEGLFRFAKYRLWRTSELREKSDYKSIKKDGVITYDIQKTVKYGYTETETDLIYAMHFKKKYICTSPIEPVSYTGMWNGGVTKTTGIDQYVAEEWAPGESTGPYGIDDWEVYKFADYAISVGVKELHSVEEIEYDEDKQFITTTSYVYNDHHLLKETRKTNSRNEVLLTETKYPFDFPDDPVHQLMINSNMVDVQVESNTYKNSAPVASLKTTYKDWGNNIQPEFISTRTGSNPYEHRISFHSYDSQGNIQAVSKDNGANISYIYGYDEQLPIAQVTNAAHDQIVHTSFEESEGNSGENDAKTGRKSRIGGYSRTITGLSNGDYVLTYWQKNDQRWELVPVNNISVSTGSYTINLTGQIDEVRFYPVGAVMTTYSYDPLEGLLSSTDENNVTTYYDYDGYQRLMTIKDLNRNALKHFDYHYKQ